ncbi:IS4 family transposase [Saccharospirillum salsuginis]|uniref:IS4 family transposase n=1 Tax=Saccharospirillum salsuginis TaxID=418750 RepID=A0A918KMN0_9GAMM|nr:IS4 family transposase [Saccharospirillum salsuginis]GGX68948.1 IS4 family transposase [Saccharospirillum salsuginis]
MAHTSTILSQLLKILPRQRFQKSVDRYNGDKRCRTAFCWDLFVAMLFGQLSGAQSFRDLVERLGTLSSRFSHLGINSIRKSTLADANQSRPAMVFQNLFFDLLSMLGRSQKTRGLMRSVQLIDSTTITLCQSQYHWANFRTGKSGIKVHTVFDPEADAPVFFEVTNAKFHDSVPAGKFLLFKGLTYDFDRAYNKAAFLSKLIDHDCLFVGRMKRDMPYEVLETRDPMGEGVLSDDLVEVQYKSHDCLKDKTLRRICFIRAEDGKELTFLTNDLERSAVDVDDLYRQRWQIELFFKWIKQNLRVKRFFGTSENAVLIQVLMAMISYVLMRLVQETAAKGLSLQRIARKTSGALMQRRPLMELFVKESDPPSDTGQMNLGLS